jgi:hypothetical protein
MAVLILFTSQNTNITAQLQKVVTEIKLFPYNFENQEVLQFQLCDHKNPEVAISRDYHGNQMGNFNILGHTQN